MARTGRPPHVWRAAEEKLGYPTAKWVLGCLGAKMGKVEMQRELADMGLTVHINTIRYWIKKVMG